MLDEIPPFSNEVEIESSDSDENLELIGLSSTQIIDAFKSEFNSLINQNNPTETQFKDFLEKGHKMIEQGINHRLNALDVTFQDMFTRIRNITEPTLLEVDSQAIQLNEIKSKMNNINIVMDTNSGKIKKKSKKIIKKFKSIEKKVIKLSKSTLSKFKMQLKDNGSYGTIGNEA